MNLSFAPQAWADYIHWQETDLKIVERINGPLQDITRHPFAGIGKPEPLKHRWQGFWSRRIDQRHRLVYRATTDAILIAQCRYHY